MASNLYLILSGVFFIFVIIIVINFQKLDTKARNITAKWFHTKIVRGYNGTWKVEDEKISGIMKFLIEMMQLLWIVSFFVIIIALGILSFYVFGGSF